MLTDVHVIVGFTNLRKEGKRGEGRKLCELESSLELENTTSILTGKDGEMDK